MLRVAAELMCTLDAQLSSLQSLGQTDRQTRSREAGGQAGRQQGKVFLFASSAAAAAAAAGLHFPRRNSVSPQR